MKNATILLLIILLNASTVFAFPSEKDRNCSACHTLTTDEADKLMGGFAVTKSVKQSPVPAMFELVVENGGQQATVYLDYGKKHLVPGPIFSLATKKPIGEPPRPVEKAVNIKPGQIPLENSLLLGNPKGGRKLIVFTDPDCPYCGKLHWELIKLSADDPDLAIYIKLYPLKMHPEAYDKARVILGAGSFELLSKAFEGERLPPPGEKDAKKPVDETIRLAESLGITSTPTLVLPDGRILPGFREAAELKTLVAERK